MRQPGEIELSGGKQPEQLASPPRGDLAEFVSAMDDCITAAVKVGLQVPAVKPAKFVDGVRGSKIFFAAAEDEVDVRTIDQVGRRPITLFLPAHMAIECDRRRLR